MYISISDLTHTHTGKQTDTLDVTLHMTHEPPPVTKHPVHGIRQQVLKPQVQVLKYFTPVLEYKYSYQGLRV